MSRFSTVWRPIVTHLIDDREHEAKTLCGVRFDESWGCADDPQPEENIEDGIGCGCLRCAAIAKKRLKDGADPTGQRDSAPAFKAALAALAPNPEGSGAG